jgi:hypothetical protein
MQYTAVPVQVDASLWKCAGNCNGQRFLFKGMFFLEVCRQMQWTAVPDQGDAFLCRCASKFNGRLFLIKEARGQFEGFQSKELSEPKRVKNLFAFSQQCETREQHK